MIDNTILKGFLSKNCMELEDPNIAKQIDLLLKTDQPHYLWYSEYNYCDYRCILIADPTYPLTTKQNIFHGCFYCRPDGNGISLLTRVKKEK